MKTVRRILDAKKHKLLSISPHATVSAALQKMAEYDIGALAVMDGEKLAGIFSERDYARKVILSGKSPTDTRVSEIMTAEVVCVQPEQTIDHCTELMTEKRIRHLPVIESDRVIGVISIGDVVKEMISELRFVIEQLEHYIRS